MNNEESTVTSIYYMIQIGQHYLADFSDHHRKGLTYSVAASSEKAKLFYAPHEDDLDEEKQAFYNELRHIIISTNGQAIKITATHTKSKIFEHVASLPLDQRKN